MDSQKKYEIIRTVIYFAISLGLFAAGWITTGDKVNLLTVVAILGCLPASKSAVSMIMYLRYRSLSAKAAEDIASHCDCLDTVYDMVFTSYDKNFSVGHMAVKGNTVIGYTEDAKFDEKAFYKHIEQMMKKDGYAGVSYKIFSDRKKYTERLDQLQELETDVTHTAGVIRSLKSLAL